MASSSVVSNHSFFSQIRQKVTCAMYSPMTRAIKINGSEVHFSFADSAFSNIMMPAFAHLECQPTRPDLRVFVWDTIHTEVMLPAPPWDKKKYLPRGDIADFQVEGYSVAYQLSSGCLSILDKNRNEAFFWVSDYEKIPYWETAAPFRLLLQWWLKKQNMTLVHGAAVAAEGGGILFPGKGGVGKSTTALRVWKQGMQYLSDDYCLISHGEKMRVHSLYCSAKIRRDKQDEVSLEEAVPGSEKAVFLIKERVCATSELKAIVIPRIVSPKKGSCLKPAKKMDAIKALIPSTIYQLAGADENSFNKMLFTVQQLPCYFLEVGSDPIAPFHCLKRLIEQ